MIEFPIPISFDVEEDIMPSIQEWCMSNVDIEDWSYIRFGFSYFVQFYKPSDVVAFKLKFGL